MRYLKFIFVFILLEFASGCGGGSEETACGNCTDEELILFEYTSDIGEFATENVVAEIIHDSSVEDPDLATDLPAIGKLSDTSAVLYCSEGQDTSKGSVVKTSCASDTSSRIYWYCDPSMSGAIGYSYDGSLWYSESFPDSESFGYFACHDDSYTVNIITSEQLISAIQGTEEEEEEEDATIDAAENLDYTIQGDLAVGGGYSTHTIQCSRLRVVWLMLESNDNEFTPTLEIWADAYSQEEYDTAFPYGLTADVAFICPDDDTYEIRVSDFDERYGGPYTLYVKTGNACGDLIDENDC